MAHTIIEGYCSLLNQAESPEEQQAIWEEIKRCRKERKGAAYFNFTAIAYLALAAAKNFTANEDKVKYAIRKNRGSLFEFVVVVLKEKNKPENFEDVLAMLLHRWPTFKITAVKAALHMASNCHNPELLAAFFDQVHPNQSGTKNITPLMCAASNCNYAAMRVLLQRCTPEEVNAKCYLGVGRPTSGFTALRFLIHQDTHCPGFTPPIEYYTEICQEFLQAGATYRDFKDVPEYWIKFLDNIQYPRVITKTRDDVYYKITLQDSTLCDVEIVSEEKEELRENVQYKFVERGDDDNGEITLLFDVVTLYKKSQKLLKRSRLFLW